MTFGEIYTRTAFKIWGDSTPPSGSTTVLTGDEGLIANVHHKLQMDYNFWFQRLTTTYNSVVDSQNYTLPSDFKEVINLLWKINGTDYYSGSLIPLDTYEGTDSFWQENNNTDEYPAYYEIVDDSIVLYPVPSEIRVLHLIYWKWFPRPPVTFTDGTNTDSDDMTTNLGEAIVNLAAAEMLDILDEHVKANILRQQGLSDIEMIKRQDYKKRQSYLIDEIGYRAF
jgi:hypothetical protein